MAMLQHYPTANLADSTLPAFSGRIRGADLTAASLTWTELVSATPEAWGGFTVQTLGLGVNQGVGLIAVGAAGAEVIIANFPATNYSFHNEIFLPIPIPAGSRVSFAAAGSTTITGSCLITGYPAALFPAVPGVSVCDCGPFDLSGSSATYGLPPQTAVPGTANTKSAWVEASQLAYGGNLLQGNALPHVYKYLGLSFVNFRTTLSTDTWWSVADVAHGAAGAEVAFIENMPIRVAPFNAEINGPGIHWIPWNRPAGDRISFRLQYSTTTAKPTGLFLFGLR